MPEIDGVPFVAFGNDELEKAAPLQPGDVLDCDQCGGKHIVQDSKPGGLFWIKCGDQTCLVGLHGKSILKPDGPFNRRPSKTHTDGAEP